MRPLHWREEYFGLADIPANVWFVGHPSGRSNAVSHSCIQRLYSNRRSSSVQVVCVSLVELEAPAT